MNKEEQELLIVQAYELAAKMLGIKDIKIVVPLPEDDDGFIHAIFRANQPLRDAFVDLSAYLMKKKGFKTSTDGDTIHASHP